MASASFYMEPPSFVPVFSSVEKSALNMAKSPDHIPFLPLLTASPPSVLVQAGLQSALPAARTPSPTYHLHLSEDEARRFAAFIAERVEFDYVQLMR